ncbi:hypothetical protein DL766_002748 [Monosporascus sp. MC13-8B]|uniref:DUF7730 domain-containing protein n=1 Tax=Monosporascus cannonballus TaxID=155416 RepID=A0ABY0HJY3_9PEZI|nr:hypothetical protein DL763_010695 [Monosporascus cannonballus]RYO94871.1 hypothetical protein DL762_000305 [Monosporascus cannonballus]RYP34907.1 hypothetical protein DL766_002748 [Monosporascus sp. MC13-8B]
MAISVPLKVRSFFRPKLGKRSRSARAINSSWEVEWKEKTQLWATHDELAASDNAVAVSEQDADSVNPQLNSPFLQKLPLEIRRMVYEYVWSNTQDHMFHVPNGRHVYFQRGRWHNIRCVMHEIDEDPDFIQKQMDMIYESGGADSDNDKLQLWQRRLSQTWGHRHWRCEERIHHHREPRVDKTNFASMMAICKRIYPEVMQSIFESHQFHFNDLYSAHRFFVSHPPAFVSHIRHLDLTFDTSFADYAPFIFETTSKRKNYITPIWKALEDMDCLQNLRVSFDVYDRGPWRTLPESNVTKGALDLRVVNNFAVELPASMPIYNMFFEKQELSGDDGMPFEIVRRPALRYWEFHPHEVERFRWDTHAKGNLKVTASLQLCSAFFGKLPLEVREMIYSEFWVVSGLNQHVFSHDGRLTHCPCLLVPGEEDERSNEFEEVWQNRRRSHTGSLVVDDKWASRFSSTWNDHWRYLEALQSLYASVTLVFTDLATAHHSLVASPTSTTPLLHSLQFSLVMSYDALHQHRYYSTPTQSPGPWVELCTTLSNLVRFDSLRQVTLRLDLADDRNWWEVRERWVLSAIRGMLARCLTVQLPEVTAGLELLKPYQYAEGDKTPFKLERYPRLQWAGTDEGHVVSRLEFLRPIERRDVVRESRLRKAKKGLKDLVSGLKGV